MLGNISLDHKSMEELRTLFGDFVRKAEVAVLNLDNEEAKALAAGLRAPMTYSLVDPSAHLFAHDLTPSLQGIDFQVTERATGTKAAVHLQAPGAHNVSNALAALCAARATFAAVVPPCSPLMTARASGTRGSPARSR